jgi:hypothetical protein
VENLPIDPSAGSNPRLWCLPTHPISTATELENGKSNGIEQLIEVRNKAFRSSRSFRAITISELDADCAIAEFSG